MRVWFQLGKDHLHRQRSDSEKAVGTVSHTQVVFRIVGIVEASMLYYSRYRRHSKQSMRISVYSRQSWCIVNKVGI